MIENFTVFGRTVSVYMLCALVGLLGAGFIAVCCIKKRGKDDTDFVITLLWASLGGLIGAHLLYGITNIRSIIYVIKNYASYAKLLDFLTDLYSLFSGAVFYGGLIGAIAVGILYARHKKLPLGDYLDVFSFCMPLFHAVGRIGCFLSGCCFGVESDFGFVMHHSVIEWANGVRRFPVQLVEAACNLIIFLVLYLMFTKNKCRHTLICVYLIVYGAVRFTLEFFRGDTYRGFLFIFSTSQWLSLILAVSALIVLLLHRHCMTGCSDRR